MVRPGLRLIAATIALSVPFGAAADRPAINDPIRDFALTANPEGQGQLQQLKLDLIPGLPAQIFLSWTKDTDGKAGNIWTVYQPEKDGSFTRLEDPCVFRPDCFYVGSIPGKPGRYLATYTPASSRDGELTAYKFDGKAFVETDLGRLEPLSSESDLFSQFFGAEVPRPEIAKTPRAEVFERLALQDAVSSPNVIAGSSETRSLAPPAAGAPATTATTAIPAASATETRKSWPEFCIAVGALLAAIAAWWFRARLGAGRRP